jgi:uncharacterized protein
MTDNYSLLKLLDNNFILHANRFIYWEQEQTLILSDTHFGKITHFRKAGIGLPQNVMKEDMQRLFDGIQFYKPTQVIIVGDLFHSVANNEHEIFMRWRKDVAHVKFILVRGNHDIVKPAWYEQAEIQVVPSILKIKNFVFVHQLEHYENTDAEEFLFCGHVHPAVSVKGLGKQSLRFPCFYFTPKHAILPAFGKFTGTYSIEPKKQDKTFAIVNNSIIKV